MPQISELRLIVVDYMSRKGSFAALMNGIRALKQGVSNFMFSYSWCIHIRSGDVVAGFMSVINVAHGGAVSLCF